MRDVRLVTVSEGSVVGSVKARTGNGFAVVERTPVGDDDELVLRVRLDRRHHR